MFEILILTPNQVKLGLLEREKLRKKYEFELRLRSLINCIGAICETAISDRQRCCISKDLLDANLKDYYEDFPNKSMKDLLEEKGWKIEENKDKDNEGDCYCLFGGE